MKRFLLTFILGLAVAVLPNCAMAVASATDSDLYYAVSEEFNTHDRFELRAQTGLDFSNSFITIYTFQGGVLYLLDPSVAVGLEGAFFLGSKKGSAEAVAGEIEKFGYDMYAHAPVKKFNGVLRFTPLSGMVNFLSKKIVKVDLSLLFRAGSIQYQTVGWGPNLGAGIETLVSITPSFGMGLTVQYEVEKPATDWLWRAGVLAGPTFRF